MYQLQALRAKEQESSVTYFMCMMKFNYPDAIIVILLSPSPPTHPPHPIIPTQEKEENASDVTNSLCGTVTTKYSST